MLRLSAFMINEPHKLLQSADIFYQGEWDGENETSTPFEHPLNRGTTSSTTYAAWIKLDNITDKSTMRGIFLGSMANGGHSLRFNDTSGFYVDVTRAYSSAASRLYDGEWHHVAMATYNSYRYIYLDGVQVGSVNLDGSFTQASVQWGEFTHSGTTYRLDGWMDDVAVWSRRLYTSDIASIYEAGRSIALQQADIDLYAEIADATAEMLMPGAFLMSNEAHPLITNADLFYNDQEQQAPVVETLSRNSRLTTTYSVWVKLNAGPESGATAGIFGHQSGTTFAAAWLNGIYLREDGRLVVGTGSGLVTGVDCSDHFTDGQWHHYALTVNGDIQRAYVDGQFVAEANYTKNSTTLDTMRFGSIVNGNGDQILNGELDDMAVISRVLTDNEIASVYDAGRSGGGTDIFHPAEPIEVTAEMLDADVEALRPHVNLLASPLAATASLPMPGVRAERDHTVTAEVATAEALMMRAVRMSPELLKTYIMRLDPTHFRDGDTTLVNEGSSDHQWIRLTTPYSDAVRTGWGDWNGRKFTAHVRWRVTWGSDRFPITFTSSTADNTYWQRISNIRTAVGNDSVSFHSAAWNSGVTVGVGTNLRDGAPHTITLVVTDAASGDAGLRDFLWYFDGELIYTHADVPVNSDPLEFLRRGSTYKSEQMSDHTVLFDYDLSAAEVKSISSGMPVAGSPWMEPLAAGADAEMLEAHGYVTTGVLVNASVTDVEADMPGGRFPDANITANPMAGSALMGAAWFRSARTVDVDAASATAESIDIEYVGVVSNINATPAAATSRGVIIDPHEVDDRHSDPYWRRVTGNATEGVTNYPPIRHWLRFNDRFGNVVQTWDAAGNPRGARDIEGNFEWGADAPNGKRGVSIFNAGVDMGQPRGSGAASGTVWQNAASEGSAYAIEFTLRVAPGHTGRMDIMNGETRQTQQYAPSYTRYYTHVSVRDGHLYLGGNRGGTSIRRIDDGEWHHIVLTRHRPREIENYTSTGSGNVAMYIDGRMDRRFSTWENILAFNTSAPEPGSAIFAYPEYLFGQDTGYAFRGDFVDFRFYNSALDDNRVADLYYDMFGYKPVRVPVTNVSASMLDAKVESNMKRMLVLGFEMTSWTPAARAKNEILGQYVNRDRPIAFTPIMIHGFGAGTDVGNYRMTYQSAVSSTGQDAAWEKRGRPDSHAGGAAFRDNVTGRPRLINLQEDVNLDDFDVITVQNYPDVTFDTQEIREYYERFFRSLDQALIDGKKLWINDPTLAADMGWISRFDEVPTLRTNGNDVYGYESAPFVGGKVERPADGSMPVLPKGRPWGAMGGLVNLWSWDMHHNNGYRVVNEVEGLTTLPSWEMTNSYMRNRRQRIPVVPADSYTYGFKMDNRTDKDFTWSKERRGVEYEMVKPTKGLGLNVGDEYYDFTWYEYMHETTNSMTFTKPSHRTSRTWAIPPGHLRLGTPVTTFRSTLHDDFGREVPNPWRNHIRNAVVRPGDSLPDGRKVKGYAYMDFAAPSVSLSKLSGEAFTKQLTYPPGVPNALNSDGSGRPPGAWVADAETEDSFEWDYLHAGRIMYDGRGDHTQTTTTINYQNVNGVITPVFNVVATTYALGFNRTNFHPTTSLVHLSWPSRALSWLLTVDEVKTEYATQAPLSSLANGSMLSPMVSTEFERTVKVGAARASATIVAPAEATIKSTTVQAWAATASGHMTGLTGGFSAEAAQAFVSMPQNVQRTLDIGEILFFTVHMANDPVILRMEEN